MRTAELMSELMATFEGSFDEVSLRRELDRTLAVFGQQPGPEIDPLVAGYLTDRLRAIAAGRGLLGRPDATVLFVCVHNAGRSQMAASMLRARAPHLTVLSAGSRPGAAVNSAALQAMAELGIDLSGARPEQLTEQAVRRADVAITMGCGDACPVLPGTVYLDWPVPDPAGQPLEVVRGIRDEISRRVDDFLSGQPLAMRS